MTRTKRILKCRGFIMAERNVRDFCKLWLRYEPDVKFAGRNIIDRFNPNAPANSYADAGFEYIEVTPVPKKNYQKFISTHRFTWKIEYNGSRWSSARNNPPGYGRYVAQGIHS